MGIYYHFPLQKSCNPDCSFKKIKIAFDVQLGNGHPYFDSINPVKLMFGTDLVAECICIQNIRS